MNLKTVAALLALPLLAACAPEIESSIYMQDVVAVAGKGEAISVPAILRVPQGSKDECEKGLAQLIANLATLAPTTGEGKCIEKTNNGTTDQLAEIETQMVIATPDSPFDAKNLFLLEVAPVAGAAPGTHDLTFRLLKPIGDIVKVLSDGSGQMQVEFDPAIFLFNLVNDGAGSVSVLPNQVFLDDLPRLPEMGAVTVDRREDATLKFSDVAAAYVEQANAYRFATITIAP